MLAINMLSSNNDRHIIIFHHCKWSRTKTRGLVWVVIMDSDNEFSVLIAVFSFLFFCSPCLNAVNWC